MKESNLSFNCYLTHGSLTLLFYWCLTVRSPCFSRSRNTQANLIINLSSYSLTAYTIVHASVFVSYSSVKFCFCVCLYPSVRLLAEPQGTLAVWCNVPRGRILLAAPPERGGGGGGKETGAHFLWKWGYHFTNYWCNYNGRPAEAWEQGLYVRRWALM